MADSDLPPWLLPWGTTAAVILAVFVALLLARPALEPRLEALPDFAHLTSPEPSPPVEAAPVEAAPAPEPEEPAGPQLTYEDIETMLAPLPDQVLRLIDDGRAELRDFRGIDSDDEKTRSRSRRFFKNWGTTWNNRIAELEKDTPPSEECRIHASLEPACAMLAEAYELLRQVPSVASTEDATTILDSAQKVVEDFLNPPEPEEDEEGEDELTEP